MIEMTEPEVSVDEEVVAKGSDPTASNPDRKRVLFDSRFYLYKATLCPRSPGMGIEYIALDKSKSFYAYIVAETFEGAAYLATLIKDTKRGEDDPLYLDSIELVCSDLILPFEITHMNRNGSFRGILLQGV